MRAGGARAGRPPPVTHCLHPTPQVVIHIVDGGAVPTSQKAIYDYWTAAGSSASESGPAKAAGAEAAAAAASGAAGSRGGAAAAVAAAAAALALLL